MSINEPDNFEIFKTNISYMLYEVMSSAEEAHNVIFESDNKKSELLAGIFINDATSYYNSAKLYYLQNSDYEHEEFDEFFTSYDTYKNEMLSNMLTQHSHQWTDIEYREFAESAKQLASLLNMNVEHFYDNL